MEAAIKDRKIRDVTNWANISTKITVFDKKASKDETCLAAVS